MNTVLDALVAKWVKAFAANSTASAITALVDQAAAPTAFDMCPANCGVGFTGLRIAPYCVGADTDTFTLAVTGWQQIGTDPSKPQWHPSLLFSGTCTASQAKGLAGGVVLDTERYADTIVSVFSIDKIMSALYSPANDTPGMVVLDCVGFRYIQVQTAKIATTVSCNALIAPLSRGVYL